ncbi:hypothetical protein COV82_03290 [Candidatus Peregrinibacteria bacterium CG11_big_fil_rev_8_21_14_0_20_46_8]|nr:MAG: hypothetical protein COV82_03290 [Candidatus Peregrinibacteria bacterium CG11_big_fil_rev_8_21_14_0_20_46_8]
MIVYLNGRYLEADEAKISIFDPGFLYGDGIFETLRTYRGTVWQMEKHLERLYESAKIRGWKLRVSKSRLQTAIENTVKRNGFEESRIRVTITKGQEPQPTLFIWVQPLAKLPPSQYARGVSVVTFPLERAFPQMKTTSMQPLLIARSEAQKRRCFEALLVNRRGNVTEGTWANFFIVKDKELITPKAGILLGTTRDRVLKIAKPLFKIKQQTVSLKELLEADECFITNAPKGIIPVVKVDGQQIGKGRVGPITKHLRKEFEKVVV